MKGLHSLEHPGSENALASNVDPSISLTNIKDVLSLPTTSVDGLPFDPTVLAVRLSIVDRCSKLETFLHWAPFHSVVGFDLLQISPQPLVVLEFDVTGRVGYGHDSGLFSGITPQW
jgi:hypothetical protein